MPNHVTHRVVVTGPAKDVARFREECIVPENREESMGGDGEFLDFNRVIPMPESLEKSESSSMGEIGYAAWYGGCNEILTYPWVKEANVKTREQLQAFLLKQDPEYKKRGDLYKRNIDQYGYPNWYEWSINNWGTKWNSYSFHWVRKGKRRLEFLFDTAWDSPEPVFEELSRMYKTLTFDVKCFDEGWGFARSGTFSNGESDYGTFKANKRLYREVYGSEPEPEEGED